MFGMFDRSGTATLRRPGRPARPASNMAQPRHWNQALKENPLTRFVPFSSLVSEHDVITRGGDFMRVWRLDGVAFECADDHLIAERHEALCSLLRNLAGGQWAVWTHRLHRKVQDRLEDPPQPGFARDLSQAYQAKLGERAMMSNELYLTLVYRPSTSRLSRALQSTQRSKAAIAAAHAEALRVMEERTAFVHRVLRGFGPQLLGARTQVGRKYSELAEFLGYLVNGCWRPVPLAAGPLYRTLPTTRVSFGGDKLELRYGEQRRCAALVDIKEYADAVEPGILNSLLYEDSEFIETQSFSILPRREAMRALELQRDQLIASDDVVASQIADMDEALNELGDGQFCMGEYHYSLVVFGQPGEDSLADAGRRAAQAIGAVGEASSLQMSPVDLVADAAWFAQMPGNWQWRPRDAKLSSRAFAALASGHNFARGKRDGNPWGEALALLRTPSGQPFYLNLHSSPEGEDSADKKLPGNTIIIGSTGVGKTTLEMFLLTLTRKWSPAPRLVLFDLDRGCEIAIRALNGRYFTLEAGKPTNLNPLQRDPTPARIQFWEQLIRTCIATPALPLLPADERAIADAVKTVAMMPPALRRFSTIRQNLPKSGENSLYERLGRWCEGGALGWAVLRNEVSETVPTFVWKVFKIGLVLAFALQSGFYISNVSDTANALAMGVASTFLPSGVDPSTVSSPYALLDKFNDDASAQVADIMKEASMFRLDLVLAGAIFSIGSVLFLCIGLFVVTLAKLFLTFVIAVGPLFILCLAWRPTARFFDSWLSMVLNAVVLTWFAFFALGLSAFMGNQIFLATRHVASIVYQYQPKVLAKEADRLENPFGFVVTAYRSDPEINTQASGARP